MKRLIKIQSTLKAPKGQWNDFSKYHYRSCEDILEAVKPLCAAEKCALILSDNILQIGDRFYVEATAALFGEEGTEIAHATAKAREQATKKGLDEAQITGAASSYARKYALCGLFGIDDTKDADTMDNREQGPKQAQHAPAPAKAGDKKIFNRIYAAKSVAELQEIYNEIIADAGDARKDVLAMYQASFTARKQAILKGGQK